MFGLTSLPLSEEARRSYYKIRTPYGSPMISLRLTSVPQWIILLSFALNTLGILSLLSATIHPVSFRFSALGGSREGHRVVLYFCLPGSVSSFP